MKINISCAACRKNLAVDSSLVGKKAKCPSCEEIFVVAAPEVQTTTERACPGCGAAVESDTVICTGCGLNQKTGERLGSMKPDRKSEAELTLGNSFGHAFTFPLTGHGIQMLITVSVGAVIAMFMPFGGILFLGIYYGCLIDVMRSAAGGLGFKPEIQMSEFFSEMLLPGIKLVIVMLVVVFVPVVAVAIGLGIGAAALQVGPESGGLADVLFGSASGLALLAVLIFIAAYLPMSVAISGIYNTVLDAINPVTIFRSIAKIPGEYALVALFIYGLVSIGSVLEEAMSVHWTLSFLGPAVSFYLNAVAVSRLGFMSHTNRAALGW